MDKTIVIKDLLFKAGERTILNRLNLSIEKGEWLSIVGPSGAGKSTLLYTIAGIKKPNSGTLIVLGENLGKMTETEKAEFRRNKIGFIFQELNLVEWLNAVENVMLAQHIHSIADREEALKLLKKLDLENKEHLYPHQLSGGEKQRLAIARAIVNDPEIILADEPTANLDEISVKKVLDILSDLQKRGKTIIMVTHDYEVAAKTNRIITLKYGKIQNREYKVNDEEILVSLWFAKEGDHIPEISDYLPYAKSKGWIHLTDDGFIFSQIGKMLASDVVKRKRLAEILTLATLNIESPPPCCSLPPLREEETTSIEAMLKYPKRCPHGRIIPYNNSEDIIIN